MTDKTTHDPDGALPADLEAARAAAWEEHERRCASNEPYSVGATIESLTERVEGLRCLNSRFGQSGQNYASAVSDEAGPHSVGGSSDEVGIDAVGELAWVAVLPESDRRLFAEEMSRLMAEAAETDDLALVEQALREWRVTAETFSDPELAERLSKPLVADGALVPRPVA